MKRVIIDQLSKLSRYRVSSFHSFIGSEKYSINRYNCSIEPFFPVSVHQGCGFSVNCENFSHEETIENDNTDELGDQENGEEEEQLEEDDEGDEAEDEAVVDEVDVVKAENEELKNTIKELKDSYARAVADRENARRIAQEDVKKATNYSISSFAVQICDISDNLTMATQSIENILELILSHIEENDDDGTLSKRINSTFRGIEMTNQLLQNELVNRGITPMDCEVGEEFNPEYQSAVFKKPTDEVEKVNTVAEIIKAGYFIQDRVLRASQVVVFVEDETTSSPPENSNNNVVENEEEEEEPKMI